MSKEQEMREAFEKVHCNNNKHITRRNEHGDYVLPSIQDAYSGWQAATLAAEARIRDLEADAKAGRLFKDMALVAHQNGEKGFWVKLDAALTEHKENHG